LTDGRGLLVPGAVLLGLAATAAVAWSALLGGFAIAVAPVAVLAAPALAGPRPGRRAAAGLAMWVLAVPLLAGVPWDQLAPGAWTALPARLVGGVQQLAGPVVPRPDHDPWPLAAAVLLAGAAWIAAAALMRRHIGVAFAAGAAPWVAAALLDPAHAAMWQGAAVVLAGLLLHAWPRTSARAAVALSVVVAVASAIAAQAVVPRHRWFDVPGWQRQAPVRFRVLDTEPTFAPLADRRDGAPMLEIAAAQPALWRMQALDVFDGQGWRVSRRVPRLPEPAARAARIDVRVRGLQNDLVASPGTVYRVDARGTAHPVAGTAWRLRPAPQEGDRYRVDARVVRPVAGELRRARSPDDARLAAYTRLGWGHLRSRHAPAVLQLGPFTVALTPGLGEIQDFPIDVPLFGRPRDPRATAALGRTPYRGVAALAQRLAAGARTEWEVVVRVMRYLQDEDRFRYTTDVGPPGPLPLADFLLRTHAGYCQHFAGAAALLLRLAGVPARMVMGFATGVQDHGRFEVRDVDAHAWTEVYFEGYGWVPFNPTPAGAPAAIPPELDLLAATGGRARRNLPATSVILGLLAAVALAGLRLRSRPRLEDALTRLLGTPVPPSTTLRELSDELARTVGPHTSALAAEAERARFAPQGAARSRWTSARIARAVARDVGPARAVLLLALPAARRPPDH
jgi:transglutaminase-like putative cysteine protease